MQTMWLPFLAVLLVAWAFPGPGVAQGPPGAATAPVLATQQLGSDIVVEITEFRRKGNTLTVQMRFRNNGTEGKGLDFWFRSGTEIYLFDPQGRKKYLVLKADDNSYIANMMREVYWQPNIGPGRTVGAWMKFPAPPADVKQIAFVFCQLRPFDDLPIQDD